MLDMGIDQINFMKLEGDECISGSRARSTFRATCLHDLSSDSDSCCFTGGFCYAGSDYAGSCYCPSDVGALQADNDPGECRSMACEADFYEAARRMTVAEAYRACSPCCSEVTSLRAEQAECLKQCLSAAAYATSMVAMIASAVAATVISISAGDGHLLLRVSSGTSLAVAVACGIYVAIESTTEECLAGWSNSAECQRNSLASLLVVCGCCIVAMPLDSLARHRVDDDRGEISVLTSVSDFVYAIVEDYPSVGLALTALLVALFFLLSVCTAREYCSRHVFGSIVRGWLWTALLVSVAMVFGIAHYHHREWQREKIEEKRIMMERVQQAQQVPATPGDKVAKILAGRASAARSGFQDRLRSSYSARRNSLNSFFQQSFSRTKSEAVSGANSDRSLVQ